MCRIIVTHLAIPVAVFAAAAVLAQVPAPDAGKSAPKSAAWPGTPPGAAPDAPGAPLNPLAPPRAADTVPALEPLPANLEEMLAIALRSNPEILKADARLRKAQADLNAARLKAVEEVTSAFQERRKETELAGNSEREAERYRKMFESGQATYEEAAKSMVGLAAARVRIAQIEGRLRYLLGAGGLAVARGIEMPERSPRADRRRPEMPEKMRELLDRKVTVTLKGEGGGGLEGSLAILRSFLGDIPIVVDISAAERIRDTASGALEFKEAPMKNVLAGVADLFDAAFVFRDYGILVTRRQKAESMNAPTIPWDIPLR